jgi:hypothetical protein
LLGVGLDYHDGALALQGPNDALDVAYVRGIGPNKCTKVARRIVVTTSALKSGGHAPPD